MYTFNITLKELNRAVKFAKKHGVSNFKTIVMTHKPGAIGGVTTVSTDWNKENSKDISEYEAF